MQCKGSMPSFDIWNQRELTGRGNLHKYCNMGFSGTVSLDFRPLFFSPNNPPPPPIHRLELVVSVCTWKCQVDLNLTYSHLLSRLGYHCNYDLKIPKYRYSTLYYTVVFKWSI
jgi:hypothetical protein